MTNYKKDYNKILTDLQELTAIIAPEDLRDRIYELSTKAPVVRSFTFAKVAFLSLLLGVVLGGAGVIN